jgi:hypothetical protein
MLIWKAWDWRPTSLIKMREEVQALYDESGKIILIKVENVLNQRISVIDLNHYRIKA